MTSSYVTGTGSKWVRQKVVMVATVSASFCVMPTFAQEASYKDFPYLIYCEYQGIDHAFYFSKLGIDGVAVYLTPDRQAGMITISGVSRRIGGEQSGTCSNKTLDDLRSSRQAFDLPK